MDEQLRVLKVIVVQGKRLVIRDFNSSDPYVVVKLGNQAQGLDPVSNGFGSLVRRVVKCFGPAEFSVAVTCQVGAEGWAMSNADVEGYCCDCENVVKLPGKGCVVYRTYAARGPKIAIVNFKCSEEIEKEEVVVSSCVTSA